MAKRLSPHSDGSEDQDDSQTGFDEVATKKRRLVEFDSIRLLSVTAVDELDHKAARVKLYKLSEAVRYKNRVIAQKDREIERLRQRQNTDENTSCTINRHWNNLDEQMRLMVLRGSSSQEVDQLLKDDVTQRSPSPQFLEEVVQLTEEERKAAYDKRVQASVQLLEQVLQLSITRSEQFKGFSKKLVDYMEASTSADPTSRDDAMNELVHNNSLLADENLRLTKDCSKLQKQLSDVKLQMKEAIDKNSQIETKNEELLQELDDLKYDSDKAWRQVNKLDYKLYTVVKEQRDTASCSHGINQNGSKMNGVSANGDSGNMQVDQLRAECEQQTELAANRLAEIKELNERILKYVQDLEQAKIESGQKSMDHTTIEKELNTLKTYFSVALDEGTRLRSEIETAVEERELIRQEMFTVVEEMKREEQLAIRKVLSSSEQINRDNLQVRTEYDMLRLEFEQSLSTIGSSDSKTSDVKTLIGSLHAQVNQLKSEGSRTKKKWKDSVHMLQKAQASLEAERQKLARSLVIDLENADSNEMASPEQAEGKSDDEEMDITKLRERLAELRLKLEAFQSAATETRELATIIANERRVKLENHRLLQQIRKMGNMEKKEKIRYFEAEYQRQMALKEMEVSALRKERDDLLNADGALNQEVESIGQALEELQEQNSSLIKQKQYLEEEKMKMMGDRISSSQIQQKLVAEKALLETQVVNVTRQMQAEVCEHTHVKESLALAKQAIATKTKENMSLHRSIETFRKQVLDLSIKSDGLVTVNEKINEQLKSLQEVVMSKASQHELDMQKNKRLEEDKALLKKKLKVAKKSVKLGSTDAVLEEEIKELKEVLTCPSCKVNRKDAILTKCFHVFCLKCLKTRYDTRQRKCPKCNVGFGANDFQRAYIG